MFIYGIFFLTEIIKMESKPLIQATIYKITSPSIEKVYVGQTTKKNINCRFAEHRCNYESMEEVLVIIDHLMKSYNIQMLKLNF